MRYHLSVPSLPFFSIEFRFTNSTELRLDQILGVGFTLDKKRLGMPTDNTEEHCLTLAIKELGDLVSLMREYAWSKDNDHNSFKLAIGFANLIHGFNHIGGRVPIPKHMFRSVAELKTWVATSSEWLEEMIRLIETCRHPNCPTANYQPVVSFFVAWSEQTHEASEDTRRGFAA